MANSSPLLESPLLRQLAPYTVAGYTLFRDIVELDGAVPARLKALFTCVGAVNKGHGELARREMQRARTLGLSRNEAASGLILLSSLRGEGVALLFKSVLDGAYPVAGTPNGQMADIKAEPGEAERNFKEYFGTVPPALAKLLALSPKGADAYYLMRKGTIECNTLEKKYAELMLITVLATDYSPMALTHIKAARRVGATDEELAEAILCAVPAAGIAAWMGAAPLLDSQ